VPSLLECLAALPHRDLRAVATHLGLRQRGHNRKDDWVGAVVHAWETPDSQRAIIAALSPAARASAARLAGAGELPAPLFFAEYGRVRRPRRGKHWSPPPWEAPETASEELYYCGLLSPATSASLDRTPRLTMAAELQQLFAGTLPVLQPVPDELVASVPSTTAAALIHDLGQVLAYLLSHPHLPLLHGRWLAPAALAELNQRLLRPEIGPRPRSHKRSPRLRFLFFLATAANLQVAGQVTPLGWTWLAEPPAERLRLLWQAWQETTQADRRAYAQPIASLPPPWPRLALAHLPGLPAVFTAAELAQTVLGTEKDYTAYFAAHAPDIRALDAAAVDLLSTLAHDWGVVVSLVSGDPTDPAAPCSLSAVGHWLLDPARNPIPAEIWGRPELSFVTAAITGAQLDTRDDNAWQVAVSAWAELRFLAILSPYAAYRGFDRTAQPPLHRYVLSKDTVATASATGYGMASLFQALSGLGLALTADQVARLHVWHGHGREFSLAAALVLRAARPELMAQLLEHPELRAGLGAVLSSAAATVALQPGDMIDRLRAAGLYAAWPAAGVKASPDSASAGKPPASSPADPVAPEEQTSAASTAALWLAGRLYAALGEHLVLPLPPPFAELDRVMASLPAVQQAVMLTQWESLQEKLTALLDGQAFTPPPRPADPARWRPLIESAIASNRSLAMTYFTAGRNVLTQRTVTPYWIEEHHGIAYLRADCHTAGRVRLFRLDRIQSLDVSPS
jgi:hypothetical protein